MLEKKNSKNNLSVKEKLEKLRDLMSWFDSDDFKLEEAIEHFKKADELACEIEKDLLTLKNEINILKDKANMVVRKYALYLESKNKGIENPQILELPEVAVKKLTGSEKDVFAESEIIEIVSASNPTKAFKNIEIKKNNERMSSREERKNYLKKELTRIETKIKKWSKRKRNFKTLLHVFLLMPQNQNKLQAVKNNLKNFNLKICRFQTENIHI